MKRLYFLCFFLMLASLSVYAQADVEAKAAYLLAEESYGKGDMKTTLEYLNDASGKLGAANSKILYLQIMAQRELANKDRSFLPKLDSTIALFQKSADIATFNEDKILEVTKIKLQLKKEMVQNQADDDATAKSRTGIISVEHDYPDWPLGASLATLQSKHPDIFKLLTPKASKFFITQTPNSTIYSVPNAAVGVLSFSVFHDQLGSFLVTLFRDYNDKDNIKGKKALADQLEDLKKRMGNLPKPSITDGPTLRNEIYNWQEDNKQLVLLASFSSLGISTVSMSITDSSIK